MRHPAAEIPAAAAGAALVTDFVSIIGNLREYRCWGSAGYLTHLNLTSPAAQRLARRPRRPRRAPAEAQEVGADVVTSSEVARRSRAFLTCIVVRYSVSLMVRYSRDADDLLPLTPGMFHVLIALADGEKHGYAIIKEVARRTDGTIRLSAGTLYTLIRRFVQEGVIAESAERPDPALDDERRRYYRLTDFGRRVAQAEARRMENALGMARAKRLIPKARPS